MLMQGLPPTRLGWTLQASVNYAFNCNVVGTMHSLCSVQLIVCCHCCCWCLPCLATHHLQPLCLPAARRCATCRTCGRVRCCPWCSHASRQHCKQQRQCIRWVVDTVLPDARGSCVMFLSQCVYRGIGVRGLWGFGVSSMLG
jgi:hypothetical protein